MSISPPAPPRAVRTQAGGVIAADLGWHARGVARRITAALDAALAPSGLTSPQFALMCLVASAPDDTLGALAAAAGVDPSTMSRNVDQLVAAGWAELVAVERDRRRRAVWLTEEGVRRLQQAMPLWRTAHAAVERGVGAALRPRFVAAAAALDRALPVSASRTRSSAAARR
ncbi:MAG: winged helix-turn-helix transcriptional regulator [Rubrivivax sp.]|nr:winged helix-turn-helix transcriptional regulator [Rubrivivax sp.]